MHYGDLSDSGSLINLIRELEPDEIYHLGARATSKVSVEVPKYPADGHLDGCNPDAGGHTGFGRGDATSTMRHPRRCMLGFAAAERVDSVPPAQPLRRFQGGAYWSTVNYRDAYDLFACNGILFNDESIRRRRRS
jgi:GDPmannose 4,6-dehydratase